MDIADAGPPCKLSTRKTSVNNSCSENDIGNRSSCQWAKLSGEWDVYNITECQKVACRMAQGEQVDAEDRTKLLFSIKLWVRTNPTVAKTLLYQLTNGHLLQSYFKRLFQSSNTTNANSLSNVWNKFYCEILPNLQAVLYPYEEYSIQIRPPIRNILLCTFRDLLFIDDTCYALLRGEYMAESNEFRRMLLVLEQCTRDCSANYWKLRRMCEQCCGKLGIWDSLEDTGALPIRRKMAISATAPPPTDVSPL